MAAQSETEKISCKKNIVNFFVRAIYPKDDVLVFVVAVGVRWKAEDASSRVYS